MGKTYKGKICVYCGADGASQTGDHVFARRWFPKEHQANLPQVPACRACNQTKAELEHYLLTLLPFAGRQPNSSALLTATAPARLAKNAKLHRELAEGRGQTWVKENGIIRSAMTLPFDGTKLSALFALVTRGMVTHSWQTQIPQDYYVGAGLLTAFGASFLEPFLQGGGQHAVGSLGEGLIDFHGVQATDNPFLTVWRFRIYGGAAFGGDPKAPGHTSSDLWALSARDRPAGLFDES
jgi:hypothetical protein